MTFATLATYVTDYSFIVSASLLVVYPVLLLFYHAHAARAFSQDDSTAVGDSKPSSKKPASVTADVKFCWNGVASRAAALVPNLTTFVQLTALVAFWPAICSLPLVLTLGSRYKTIFPVGWYDERPVEHSLGHYGFADPTIVKPLGLILGVLAVVVGHAVSLVYHALRRARCLGDLTRIQPQERTYDFVNGLKTHLAQPEGFALIGGYLIGTWMLGWMPSSYYSFEGGINWWHVVAQLLLQDAFQFIMHYGEHKVSTWIYRMSHKPHHRFTNPRLFDAFDGSLTDTMLMIVVPFLAVKRFVPANVWSYMTFGSLYANWLVLVHSEFIHPWDRLFRAFGLGTPADHHVHHRFFVFNYGHLFMYWDKLCGTYRDPRSFAGNQFSEGVRDD